MHIIKTIKENNIEINFVNISLKDFETELYFNKRKGYIHRKMIYSNVKIQNPKSGTPKKVKVNNNKCKFIIIVEEKGQNLKKYTVYIKHDWCIEEINLPLNHIITSEILNYINSKILEENEKSAKMEAECKMYATLPVGVKSCIPFEDIQYLEKAISENTWYRNQMERLNLLPFVLGSSTVKKWLSKLGIFSISKNQSDIDSLAVYVAFRLTRCLQKWQREIVIEKLQECIPKGEEEYYSCYFS